ncbi:MAG: GCG_CRPN prefix-to-repeats domain-containing protein [Rhodomicrobium sp.]
MKKQFVLLSVSAVAAGLACTSAQAWDNCGHGAHRNYWGRCVSNYGRTSGCPRGYHLGWNVHRCVRSW